MSADLDRYLKMLAGRKPGERLLEVRSRTHSGVGMTQRYFRAASERDQAAEFIAERSEHVDVYVSVVTRDREAGGKAAVSGSHLVWVEIDSSDAYRHLLRAPLPPSAVVGSGSFGHLHAYWQLTEPVDVAECESTNRRLAALLAGDQASTDVARILRPPTSVNHKREPTPVSLEHLDLERRYGLSQLAAGLPVDPKRERERTAVPRRPPIGARPGDDLTRTLRSIPTADYVEALTGRVPNADSKIQCPFHGNGQERTPSLHCFADGCFQCFGCSKGGTIFDFAGALLGRGTKGREFMQLRDELASRFGISRPPAPTQLRELHPVAQSGPQVGTAPVAIVRRATSSAASRGVGR